ncbi:MAG: RHS repeat-associated core domain-containing protein [Eubacterium sp.]|nr:RHS repeat-associated core domain-containing protein [Eubacterium sp.]
MGDVIAIADKNGDVVAAYKYDAWGKLLAIDTLHENNETELDIANANPLRYRGYYYDNETGYYYLQSRYYDPSICRFINADDIDYATKDVSNGINIFAYCYNNPTNNSDPDGCVAGSIAAALLTVAVIAAVIVAVLAVIGVFYTTSYILKNSDFSSVVSMIRSFGNAFKLNNIALIALLSVTIVPAYNAFKTRAKSKVKNVSDALKVSAADAEIKTKIKNDKSSNYWEAYFDSIGSYSFVRIGSSINKGSAKSRMQRNKNVFCSSQNKAYELAKSSYNNKEPVGPEIDKGKEHKIGYYHHFHVFKRKYKSHAWFLL